MLKKPPWSNTSRNNTSNALPASTSAQLSRAGWASAACAVTRWHADLIVYGQAAALHVDQIEKSRSSTSCPRSGSSPWAR